MSIVADSVLPTVYRRRGRRRMQWTCTPLSSSSWSSCASPPPKPTSRSSLMARSCFCHAELLHMSCDIVLLRLLPHDGNLWLLRMRDCLFAMLGCCSSKPQDSRVQHSSCLFTTTKAWNAPTADSSQLACMLLQLVAVALGPFLLNAVRLSSQGQCFIILATLSGLVLCLTPSSSCHTTEPLFVFANPSLCPGMICMSLLGAQCHNRSPCVLQGATSTSTASSACMSLNASVSGLGPAFKLTLELCNTGSQPLLGTALVSPVTADVALHMRRQSVQLEENL